MTTAPDPFEPYLNRAASLFDLGDIVQAGQIWQAILKRDPGHQAARAGLYKVKVCFDARATQDGMTPPVAPIAEPSATGKHPNLAAPPPPEPEGPPPEVAPAISPATEEDDTRVEVLIREGVQLYDMGMLPEAMGKWRGAQALEPGNQNAAEYLAMAERDQQEEAEAALRRPTPKPVPAPAPMATPTPRAPQPPIVLKLERDLPSVVPVQPPASLTQDPEAPRGAAIPPRALTTRAAPARDGLKVPGALNSLSLPPWLNTPLRFGLAAAGALVVLTTLFLLRGFQREHALKAAVLAAKADALKPVARQVEVAVLAETPEAIRHEAENAMGDDPLLAYLRAQECLRLDPADTKAAHLVEQARTGLAAKAHATREGFEKSLKSGELEAAHTAILGLLCQSPDDAELRAKARIVSLALAQHFATKERFGDAKECLCLVRALYPQETVWQGKLRLLEAIQGLPKADRAGWIAMLG